MSTNHPNHIPSSVTDANVQLDQRLRDAYANMDLKTYKVVKNGLLSFVLIGFAVFLVLEGAEPTLVFTGTLGLLTLLNGIELAEFYSAWEEVRTAQAQRQEDDKQ